MKILFNKKELYYVSKFKVLEVIVDSGEPSHDLQEAAICNIFRNRSSHQRCYIQKDVRKNFAIFAEKYVCWSLFLITLQASDLQLYLKDSSTGVSM